MATVGESSPFFNILFCRGSGTGVGEAGALGASVSVSTGRVLSKSRAASAFRMAVRDTWALTIKAMSSSTSEALTAPMPICMALLRLLKRVARYPAPALTLSPRKMRPGFIHCHSLWNNGPTTFHTARAAAATA